MRGTTDSESQSVWTTLYHFCMTCTVLYSYIADTPLGSSSSHRDGLDLSIMSINPSSNAWGIAVRCGGCDLALGCRLRLEGQLRLRASARDMVSNLPTDIYIAVR